uniref:Ell-associated factor Eaf n=1 Tax=Panagrellus redivivus TaxID=6233 RepID=A0A7E4V856_PANRE
MFEVYYIITTDADRSPRTKATLTISEPPSQVPRLELQLTNSANGNVESVLIGPGPSTRYFEVANQSEFTITVNGNKKLLKLIFDDVHSRSRERMLLQILDAFKDWQSITSLRKDIETSQKHRLPCSVLNSRDTTAVNTPMSEITEFSFEGNCIN